MNLKKILIIALIIIVVFVAGLYYLVQTALSSGGGGGGPQAELKPEYNFSVTETGVVDYGEQGDRSLYLIYSVQSKDVSSIKVDARRYEVGIPLDVYLLDHPCDGCQGKDEFAGALEARLKENGILAQNASINTVKINQLERISKRGIIVVPTGKIPSSLLERSSGAFLPRLMAMGSVVIYVGGDLTLSLGRDGTTRSVNESVLRDAGLSESVFRSPNLGPGTSAPYRLEQSKFSLMGENVTPVASAISVQRMGDGFFAAFPDNVDLGWNAAGPAAAGEDVAEFISEAAWQKPVTSGVGVLSLQSVTPQRVETVFFMRSNGSGGYTRVYVTTFMDPGDGEKPFRREFLELNVTNPVTGRMRHPPFGVNGSTLRFNIRFQENFSEPREFEVFLRAFKNQIQVQEQSLGFVNFITVDERYMNYDVNLSGGDHILRVTDITGKVYAQSFLHIPDVVIQNDGADWEKPAFGFTMLSDGIPVANTRVLVKMDGKNDATLMTDSVGHFTFIPREAPGFGVHVFTFEATGKTMSLSITRVKPVSFLDKLENQVIVVATLIIAILGIALRRTEPPKYYIDVPDFPPQKKERIPLSRFALMNLIESTNKDYRWKFMPLSLQEIKANLRKKITHQGKPILISDYNLEKLLSQLVEKGDVFHSLGFYGLKGWLNQSGKTPHYLALFRMLRNFFINHAVLFTDVGQRTDCDTLINYRGENIFVHIHESDESISRALLAARKGKNFVIFGTPEELEDFLRKLSFSAMPQAVALKMELDSNRITLAHIDSLDRILGKGA